MARVANLVPVSISANLKMNNVAQQHWGGGPPDAAGIYPSQCLLGQRFMMPFPGGSKNAIAVDKAHEVYIISLYTIIVTAIFAAWWILIATAIPHVLPSHLLTQTSAHVFKHWAINEPLQTAIIMLQNWWKLLASCLFKQPVNNHSVPGSISKGISDNPTFAWQDFTITLTIMLLAAGTYIGGNVAAILLPNKFILGHAAPANPYTLYYPRPIPKWDVVPNGILANYADHASFSALRALGMVDSGTSRELLNTTVKVEKIPSQPPSDWPHDDSYTIKYIISVTGYDMGLQHAPDLTVELQGECKFMYEWNVTVHKNEARFVEGVEWALWPNDTIWEPQTVHLVTRYSFPDVIVQDPQFRDQAKERPNTSQFVMLPMLWGISTTGNSTDPWYHGDDFYPVRPGPPVLQCWENQIWTHQEWTGTFTDIQNNGVPNLHLPNAIITMLKTHFSKHEAEIRIIGAPPLAKLAEMVTPFTLASTRTMGTDYSVNLEGCSAEADMQRLAYGAYIMTRDLFRNTALDYGLWKDSPRLTDDTKNNASLNVLRMEDGQPLPGAGDFVIYTDRATAFRFETLVALPAVLVFSWLLVPVCNWLVRCKDRKKPTEFGGDMSTAGKGGTVVTIEVEMDSVRALAYDCDRGYSRQRLWAGEVQRGLGDITCVIGKPL
ncbi:hypothetical protein BDZ91DRAFT_767114 [Kalaharituber pfeilii]|nr:hypothetical protein BDZ91DRAFT_767114 [Kalaharituber pfeilii]